MNSDLKEGKMYNPKKYDPYVTQCNRIVESLSCPLILNEKKLEILRDAYKSLNIIINNNELLAAEQKKKAVMEGVADDQRNFPNKKGDDDWECSIQ